VYNTCVTLHDVTQLALTCDFNWSKGSPI